MYTYMSKHKGAGDERESHGKNSPLKAALAAGCCPGWMAGLCRLMSAFQEPSLPLAPPGFLHSPLEVGCCVPSCPGAD